MVYKNRIEESNNLYREYTDFIWKILTSYKHFRNIQEIIKLFSF